MILARESQNYYHEHTSWAEKPRTVQKVRRVKNNSKVFYAVVLMAAFAVFLLLATRYAQLTATGYEIVDMKKQLKVMEADNQVLEMKIAKLQSLEHIEAVAMGKLGMIKPDTSEGVQFVAVESIGAVEKEQTVKHAPGGEVATNQNQQKPIAVIDALAKMLSGWTGKVAQAEARTVAD